MPGPLPFWILACVLLMQHPLTVGETTCPSPMCYPTILSEGGLGNPLPKGIWHLLFKVIFKVAMALLFKGKKANS